MSLWCLIKFDWLVAYWLHFIRQGTSGSITQLNTLSLLDFTNIWLQSANSIPFIRKWNKVANWFMSPAARVEWGIFEELGADWSLSAFNAAIPGKLHEVKLLINLDSLGSFVNWALSVASIVENYLTLGWVGREAVEVYAKTTVIVESALSYSTDVHYWALVFSVWAFDWAYLGHLARCSRW